MSSKNQKQSEFLKYNFQEYMRITKVVTDASCTKEATAQYKKYKQANEHSPIVSFVGDPRTFSNWWDGYWSQPQKIKGFAEEYSKTYDPDISDTPMLITSKELPFRVKNINSRWYSGVYYCYYYRTPQTNPLLSAGVLQINADNSVVFYYGNTSQDNELKKDYNKICDSEYHEMEPIYQGNIYYGTDFHVIILHLQNDRIEKTMNDIVIIIRDITKLRVPQMVSTIGILQDKEEPTEIGLLSNKIAISRSFLSFDDQEMCNFLQAKLCSNSNPLNSMDDHELYNRLNP